MIQKESVSLVIMDLDNTLYDWVAGWHASFSAMFKVVQEMSGVCESRLLDDFRHVHRQHNSSEYAFAIEELPSLNTLHPGEDLRKIFAPAIETYQAAKTENFFLYPTVKDTLEDLKDQGCMLVGFTESQAFYSLSRLRHLGLDRILDYLFAPPQDRPHTKAIQDRISRYDKEKYAPRRMKFREIPSGDLKPNPRVLLDIVQKLGGEPKNTIYIGDSEMKDVAMAQEAGVCDVWAKYGTSQHRPEYELLRRVTHWSDEDVKKEKKIAERTDIQHISPSYILEQQFAEVINIFSFFPFEPAQMNIPISERTKAAIEVWKKVVDVQQHFNEIEMKIRNFAISLLVTVLGISSFASREHQYWGATLFLIAGLIGWFAFYLMDRHWYHRFLSAAGKQANRIEEKWKGTLPEMGLSSEITASSPIVLLKKSKGIRIDSARKINIFYLFGAVILLIFLGGLLLQNHAETTTQITPGSKLTVPSDFQSRRAEAKNKGEAKSQKTPPSAPLEEPPKNITPPTP